MRVFELSIDNNFKTLLPETKTSWDVIKDINLKKVSNSWVPIELKFIGKGKKGDCPYLLAGLPVFSEKAINALNDLIKDSVEYLPFNCPGKVKFWGVNVIRGVHCIDYDKAKVIRFESSGRIMKVEKYAFKEEMLESVNIFKIPEDLGVVFVSENFVYKVKEAELEGFDFVELG